jgi:hypothetical protein
MTPKAKAVGVSHGVSALIPLVAVGPNSAAAYLLFGLLKLLCSTSFHLILMNMNMNFYTKVVPIKKAM